jgi:hypothetical protein
MHRGRSAIIPTILALSFFISSTPSLADTITDVQTESAPTVSEQAEPSSTGNDTAVTSDSGNAPSDKADTASAPAIITPVKETPPEPAPLIPSPPLPSLANDSASSDVLPEIGQISVQTDPLPITDQLPPVSSPNSQMSEPTATTPTSVQGAETAAPTATIDAPDIVMTKVGIDWNGKTGNDYIELYNRSERNIVLDTDWSLRKLPSTANPTLGDSVVTFPKSGICLPPGGHLLWMNKNAEESLKTELGPSDIQNTNTLTGKNGVILVRDKETIDAFPGNMGTGNNARDTTDFTWKNGGNPSLQGSSDDTRCAEPAPEKIGLVLSEIRIEGDVSSDEFIEFYNTGTGTVNLSGFDLVRKYVSETKIDGTIVRTGKEASVTKSFPDVELVPGAYYLWANREGKYASPFADTQTGYSLSENNSLALRKKDGILIDSVSWGSDTDLTRFVATDQTLPNPGKGSLVRNLRDMSWSIVGKPTPTNNRNETMTDPELPPPPPIGTIRINEVFPNSKEKGEANEWIELRNIATEPISLLGWTLRSGSGKFTWTEKSPPEQRMISADGFLVLPRSITRLALRNTDGEVTLMAPDGTTTMDSVTYKKTTEGASYGLFESARFRWSKTLTPGSYNVFGKEPKVRKSTIPKNGYRGTLVPFSAMGNKKGMKYVWDFGDGHKSYLEATSHRFVKTGSYEGSLTIRDGIEETVKPFTIKIGKYPNRDIHLTELCPNPAGTDTDKEWVRIRNDDTKRIDLSGWIIASATEKTKLVNHVILTDRAIGPGEEIVLTRADSRFTLPNERAVIELRRPDGKAVQTIEYFQDGGATENAVFTEIDDSVWTWSVPEKETDIPALSSTDDKSGSDDSEETDPFEVGMSADPDSDRLSFEAFVALGTLYAPALPDSLPRVLGASDERLKNNDEPSSESFLDALFRILNGLAAKSQTI